QLDVSTNSSSSWSKLQDVTDESTLNLTSLDPANNFYCFRLGTVNVCDGTAPVYTGSNTICSSVPDISVTNDEIGLTWNTSNPGVNSFTIERTPGPGAGVSPSSPFTYTDTDIVC